MKFRFMPVATVRLMVHLLAFLLAAGLADGQNVQPEVQTASLKAADIMERGAGGVGWKPRFHLRDGRLAISISRIS